MRNGSSISALFSFGLMEHTISMLCDFSHLTKEEKCCVASDFATRSAFVDIFCNQLRDHAAIARLSLYDRLLAPLKFEKLCFFG